MIPTWDAKIPKENCGAVSSGRTHSRGNLRSRRRTAHDKYPRDTVYADHAHYSYDTYNYDRDNAEHAHNSYHIHYSSDFYHVHYSYGSYHTHDSYDFYHAHYSYDSYHAHNSNYA